MYKVKMKKCVKRNAYISDERLIKGFGEKEGLIYIDLFSYKPMTIDYFDQLHFYANGKTYHLYARDFIIKEIK